VDSQAPHTDPQDRRLKRLAREKGFTCPECGSSEPVPKEGGELKDLPDGALEVPVRCQACEGASEMALVLSPEEAQALGLHSLGGSPEVP
jgi:transcription elongation factor Elf1